jgi:biopolymer transport protein ExbD
MRRFSQRNHLVTLNEINITPLLDLAFVLLIIFVITTPMLEQSIPLKLPTGGTDKSGTRKDQVRTIEVNPAGGYIIKRQSYTLDQLERYLAAEYQKDPQLGIWLRADKKEEFGHVAEAMEVVRRLGITKFDIAMSPPKR